MRRLAPILTLLAALSAPAAFAEVEPAFNAELGGPQKLSANLGFRVATGTPEQRGIGRGFVFQVQPGLAGGSLNAGWMPTSFAAQGTQAIGVGLKARLLRTWGSPWGADPRRTYAGVEAAAVIGVKLSIGVLWRLGSAGGGSAGAGSAGGRRSVLTWGAGIGF